ncbi:MAG TPA: DUF349 domain-containing protein [Pseudomonadales bacterium]|nr:DUF349 domain-containing protein [Pseudomonadales bacterium]
MISRFLKNLSGPSIEDPDPSRRLRAIERLEADTPPDALAEFIRSEPDAGVRLACLQRIDDAPTLLELMDHPAAASAARDRLAALLDAGLDARALLDSLGDLAAIRNLLDATGAETHWRAVLERIDGEDVLTEIAGHHRLAAVRSAAAVRVIHEEPLRQLERVARERDKEVARAVRERLDALRGARAEVDSLGARIVQLESEARHLARAEEEPRLAERVEWLRGQRNETLAAIEALGAVFARFELPAPARPAAADDLDAHLASLDARRMAEVEAVEAVVAADAAVRERHAARTSVLDALERLAAQIGERLVDRERAIAERGTLETAVAFEDARWQHALEAGDGDDPQTRELLARQTEIRARIQGLLDALAQFADAPPAPEPADPEPVAEQLPADAEAAAALWARRAPLRATLAELDGWLTTMAWPEGVEAPETIRVTRERAERHRAALTAIDAHAKRLSERVGKLCGRLERALDARKLKPAGGMFADLQRQTPLLADADERRNQRIERIRERLEELRDWEYFATAPKREALCVEMEALAEDEAIAADARAGRVKTLRADWKALGTVRGEEGKALARRFDAAAERAFAPARAHFEAEAERRAEHTANRARICDELQQFLDGYDWDSADWKAVERIHRRARDDWKRFGDVDARGRALGKRYHKLSRTLHGHLETRWKDNIARKEALVAAAEALVVDGKPVPAAAAQAKDLQAQWKQIDITPRSVDKTLWAAFRAACDAVFGSLGAARDEEAKAHVALRDTLDAATRDLAGALEALLAAGGVDRAALDGLPTGPVHAAFDALRGDPVPRDQRQKTDAALRSARTTLDAVRDAGRKLQASARIERLRSALLVDVALAEDAADEAKIAALTGPWRAAVEARRQRKDGATEERHEACVDLELALGLDSPAEDASLRMARQVARLSSGMRGELDDDPQARVEDAIGRLLACPARDDRDRALARRALAAYDAHAAGRRS